MSRQTVSAAPLGGVLRDERLRETAALLLMDRARLGLGYEMPTLHMGLTGNPGTGKTTVAQRMAGLPHCPGHLRRGHLVSVTRDDLAGQYTVPGTQEVPKKARGASSSLTRPVAFCKPEHGRRPS